MTTSTASGLSAEAKEFVPSVQIPSPTAVPLYINDNSVASVYSSEQPQSLIYPLIKFPEIELRLQSSQPSSNINPSPIVLLPSTAYYPGTQMIYPLDYNEQLPLANYGYQPTKSNRISSYRSQRGSNQNQQTVSSNNRRLFNISNHKRIPKNVSSRPIEQQEKPKTENSNYENVYQVNDHKNPFEFRSEDFPSLPMNNVHQQSDKVVAQVLPSTDTKLVEIKLYSLNFKMNF